MENYFVKIRNHFGQSMFDQLLTEFAQQSNLYVDEIKVDEWHIYGSSRLGVYEANRTISKRVARDLNNYNQITNNEYVIETPEEVLYLYASYQLERGAKRYELANHLGNVLTVISDKKTANFTGTTFTSFTAERISATDYSPFGAPLTGRTWNGGEYRFGFNSMEKDNEINGTGNAYDFGARIYDARLGRWMSVDPLLIKYPFFSPYNFCAGNPLVFVDYNGEDFRYSIELIRTRDGKTYANIVIETNIHTYGRDACSAEMQFHIKGSVEVEFNGKIVTSNVTIKVNVVAHETRDAALKAMSKGDNLLNIDECLSNEDLPKIPGFPSDNKPVNSLVKGLAIRGGPEANVRSTSSGEIFHEGMHLIGLIDRYLSAKGINIPDEGYKNTSMGGNELSQILAGLDYRDLAKSVIKESKIEKFFDKVGKFFKTGIHFGRIDLSTTRNPIGESASEIDNKNR